MLDEIICATDIQITVQGEFWCSGTLALQVLPIIFIISPKKETSKINYFFGFYLKC